MYKIEGYLKHNNVILQSMGSHGTHRMVMKFISFLTLSAEIGVGDGVRFAKTRRACRWRLVNFSFPNWSIGSQLKL